MAEVTWQLPNPGQTEFRHQLIGKLFEVQPEMQSARRNYNNNKYRNIYFPTQNANNFRLEWVFAFVQGTVVQAPSFGEKL